MTTNELMLGFYMLSLDPKDKDYDESFITGTGRIIPRDQSSGDSPHRGEQRTVGMKNLSGGSVLVNQPLVRRGIFTNFSHNGVSVVSVKPRGTGVRCVVRAVCPSSVRDVVRGSADCAIGRAGSHEDTIMDRLQKGARGSGGIQNLPLGKRDFGNQNSRD